MNQLCLLNTFSNMVPFKFLLVIFENMLSFFGKDNIRPLYDMAACCRKLNKLSYGLISLVLQFVSSFLANSHGISKRSSLAVPDLSISKTSLLVYN